MELEPGVELTSPTRLCQACLIETYPAGLHYICTREAETCLLWLAKPEDAERVIELLRHWPTKRSA